MLPFNLQARVYENLDLNEAIKLVKRQNIEISIANLNEQIKMQELKYAKSKHFGKLDFTQNFMRSNDGGNVFGFALSNREASFRNFGFASFLQNQQNPNLLDIEPEDLNYPKTRNYHQSKFKFTLPIYTGGKITNYKKIQASMLKIASLEKSQITKEKIRQTKKSFADIILIESFLKNLKIIASNINKLENMTKNMLKEGYAKKIDVLEIKAKKADILRMINQSLENKKLSLEFLSFLLNGEVRSINTKSNYIPKARPIKKTDVENISDFKKAKEALKLSEAGLKMSKANFLPNVGFMAEYGSSDEKFLKHFKKHDAYGIGIGLEWNLFNGGGDVYNYEKAKIANLKAREQIALAKSDLWLKISKLNTQIKKLDFDILSMDAELDLARDIYKNYLGRYKESLVSINDVLIKQSKEIELVLKLKELQNKKYDKIFALKALIEGDDE